MPGFCKAFVPSILVGQEHEAPENERIAQTMPASGS